MLLLLLLLLLWLLLLLLLFFLLFLFLLLFVIQIFLVSAAACLGSTFLRRNIFLGDPFFLCGAADARKFT